MTNLSFSTAILLVIVSHSFLLNSITSHASISRDNNRETLEIVIGGGGYISPAEPPDCPPPPPPPCPPPPPPPCPPPTSPPIPSPVTQPPVPPPKKPPPPPPTKPPLSPPPPPGEIPVNYPALLRASMILRKFAATVEYDPNNITKTWKGDDPCKYKGVRCYKSKNKPTDVGINFNGGHLNGKNGKLLDPNTILTEIPDLVFFHANSNNFTGDLNKISKLKKLFELDLSNNKLKGPFPKDVLKSEPLTFLDLRYNSLSGTVPEDAFRLYLDVLFLNNNHFTGSIPDNLGQVRALYLTFANNYFTGGIPSSIGNCTNTLVEVLFLNNHLSGCLPYEIGKLKHLTVFDVSINQLHGPIPHSFGCLTKMQLLNLAHNQFYGTVPEMVCKLPHLYNLTLNNNYFTQVGPECRNLIKLKKLDVKMNCILDLPNQRTPTECKTFFSMRRTCPNEASLQYIPCTIETTETSLHDVPRPAMAPSPSYAALGIHH